MAQTNIYPILPELTFVGGDSVTKDIDLVKDGALYDAVGCSANLAVKVFSNRFGTTLTINKALEIVMDSNGKYSIVRLSLLPSETLILDGEYTYQITILSIDGKVLIPMWGTMHIIKNFNPEYITEQPVEGYPDYEQEYTSIISRLTTAESDIDDLESDVSELQANKINISSIANNLTETETGKVLDATQGTALASQISQNAAQALESLYSSEAPARSTKHLQSITGGSRIAMPNNVDPKGEMYPTVSGVTTAGLSTLGSIKAWSKGKNWLDMSKLTNGPWYMDGDVLVKRAGSTADSNRVYLDLPKGINFIFSYRRILGDLVRTNISIVDKVTLERISSLSFDSPFTLTEGQLFSFICDPSFSATSEKRITFQLEMGTVATEHVPYIESKQFIRTPDGAPLRSVPNVSDQIRLNKNKYEIVRHVGVDSNISGSKYASIDTSTYINVDVVKTTAFADAVNRVATVDVIGNIRYYNKNGVELTEVAQADIDLTTSIGKCYFHSDRTLWIIVAKGAYADIASARADLGTTSLLYRLYTPIITDCEVSGNITPYPNGSIEFSPCLWGFTSEASTIIGSVDAPIGDIAKVEKLKRNERTGQLEVEVDVTANCSHDGTTLTIGSFTPGLYRYDCTVADGYSTEPSVTVAVEDIGGIETHDYAAGATAWVLTDNENKAEYFILTNAGGAAQLVMQPQSGVTKTIENNSGQPITVKTATSTGVTIETGKIATVKYNGAEFKKISEV